MPTGCGPLLLSAEGIGVKALATRPNDPKRSICFFVDPKDIKSAMLKALNKSPLLADALLRIRENPSDIAGPLRQLPVNAVPRIFVLAPDGYPCDEVGNVRKLAFSIFVLGLEEAIGLYFRRYPATEKVNQSANSRQAKVKGKADPVGFKGLEDIEYGGGLKEWGHLFTEKQYSIYRMKCDYNLSIAEIARRHGIVRPVVDKQLAACKEKIRKYIQKNRSKATKLAEILTREKIDFSE